MMTRRGFFRAFAGAAMAPAAGRVAVMATPLLSRAELSRRHLTFWGFRAPPKWWSGYVNRLWKRYVSRVLEGQ